MITIALENSVCKFTTENSLLVKELDTLLSYTDKSAEYAHSKNVAAVSRYNSLIKREPNQQIVAKYRAMIRKILFNLELLEKKRLVHLMNKKAKEFPAGLLPKVLDHLDNQGIFWELVDKRDGNVPKNGLKLIKPLPDLRYYQIEAVKKALEDERGVLEMSTGTGKTLIIAKLLSELKVNTLIITPSVDITEGVLETMETYFGEKQVSLLKGKKPKFSKINVVNIQALAKMDPTLFKDIHCIITDESHHCLARSTKIVTDQGRLSIGQIVDQNIECKVLSYNKQTGALEYKKVVNRFKYKAPNDLMRLTYETPAGKTRELVCTFNHKVWTSNRGYVEAEDLTLEDDVVINDGFVCKVCGKEHSNSNAMGGCVSYHERSPEVQISLAKMLSKSPNHNSPDALAANRASMLGDRNPMRNSETRAKMGRAQKRRWAEMPEEERAWRIETFVNAPVHGLRKGPTRLENIVTSLRIAGLEFTGNGSVWLRSEDRNMNPDFVYRVDGIITKVVEVGDTEYWHNTEDITERMRLMAAINLPCLYLTTKDFKEKSEIELKFIVEGFING